jgi:putative PIN family toxin of toxin-antitoxin system
VTPPLIVLDTVVLVAAIIGKPGSADAELVVDVATGNIRLALSDDGLREIVRVLGYPEVEGKVKRPVRAFEIALALGLMGRLFHPKRLDWPSLKDPKDGWIFDLAFECGADHIVTRDKHLLKVGKKLGFKTLTPYGLLNELRKNYESNE